MPRRSLAAQEALTKSVSAITAEGARISNILWMEEQHPLVLPVKNKRDVVHTIIVIKQSMEAQETPTVPIYSVGIGTHRYRASETRFIEGSDAFKAAGFRCVQVKLEVVHQLLPLSSYLTKNKGQIWVLWPGKEGPIFKACRRLSS